jgi:hypothetical protein
MTLHLPSEVKILKVKAASAAGTSAINSDTVDTLGYKNVAFITTVGAIVTGATTSIKLEHDDASGMGTVADVSGKSIAIADDDDNQSFLLSYNVEKRYVRCTVSRADQNATVGEIYALLYNAGIRPITNAVADTFNVI